MELVAIKHTIPTPRLQDRPHNLVRPKCVNHVTDSYSYVIAGGKEICIFTNMKNNSIENAFPCHVPDRMMDDAILSFDLPAIIEKIKQEEAWKMGQRNAITLLKNSRLRIVLIALHRQTEINFHQSGSQISVQLMEGKISFQTEDRSIMLKKGGLLTCHEDSEHTLIAIEDSIFLLTIATDPVSRI